jgi:lipoyl(octanoyl) transferase
VVAIHAERLTLGSETGSPPADPTGDRQLLVSRLPGLVPYLPMWEWQRCLVAARERGEIGDSLLLLEHPHVYTIGRGGDRKHLLADPVTLERIGATYHEVDRGGDITYHGPGQLVGYPIVTLASIGRSVRAYVRGLERAIIQTAARFGVAAHAVPGYTGVWVGDDKLAAIGVRVSGGVAYHGFALNVSPDLSYFDYIVPCGITDRGVTSLARLLGRPVSIAEVAPACAAVVADVFGVECAWAGLPDRSGWPEPG